jgi:sporulation protein YlmC with PRC-barrel domain
MITRLNSDVDSRRVSDIFISSLDKTFQTKHNLEERRGIIISYNGIKNIQDIVLISDLKPRAPEPEGEVSAGEEQHPGIIEE